MAKTNAVWGIDIGQSGLKALRCTKGEGDSIVADRYDFIEYPKILSAADAEPEAIIKEALEQFLSRNEVAGDSIAISVPGQAGLSRFFKPPPVEARKMGDIVKFEVSQQIPFPIEDVIWDWQQMGGSTDEDGRTVDAEIGLFAMKRDAVFRALQPFDDAGVEVDIVQLSPLSVFNVVCHDYIDELPTAEEFDPEDPPESIVMISMGTDTTDLIVSNGVKLWMRNIPIGGNHFTKQLSREMKLTQAKAEHLKRNAKMAENPKAVFQAMRPVFNDLVNEVQRSLTFFESMDKSANISEMVLLGNAAKLPGLTQFLGKQLEIKVSRAKGFKHLDGDEVTSQSTFANNSLSFAPCYGLCLQGLSHGQIKTNLLPNEMVIERVIRAKKPWVLASVSLLLLGCSLGLFYKTLANENVAETHVDADGTTTWDSAMKAADRESKASKTFVTRDTELKELLGKFKVVANELTASDLDRASWIEIYSALYQALPKDENIEKKLSELPDDAFKAIDPKEVPFAGRREIYIDHIETEFQKDLGEWHAKIEKIFENQNARDIDSLQDDVAADKTPKPATAAGAGDEGEDKGKLKDKAGWVIEIQGHHFFNEDPLTGELDFVRSTFLKNLTSGTVKLPEGDFTYEDLGISYPTVVRVSPKSNPKIISIESDTSGSGMGGMGMGGIGSGGGKRSGGSLGGGPGGMGMGGIGGMGMGGMGMGDSSGQSLVDNEKVFEAKEYIFVVQMAWIPKSTAERNEAKTTREEAAAKAEADAAAAAAETN